MLSRELIFTMLGFPRALTYDLVTASCLYQCDCYCPPTMNRVRTCHILKHVILNEVKDLFFAADKADPSLRSG